MEQTTFLDYYRICLTRDGAPRELSATGAIVTYKAVDERTGEPVALKLIPVESVDPAMREQFDKEVRGAERLNHINVAKVFDFGCEADHFVYVSECVPGERLDSWVEEHGPMPPEPVLHIAAQVVSALSTVSFHRLRHRAVQPSNLVIVPGSTPEGDWPFVKLTNLGLAGLKSGRRGDTDSSRGELEPAGGDQREQSFSIAPEFASPEQIQQGTVDFRSEIYSLGATMYFLLTGAAPSAELRRQQLRILPKALRPLLSQMLHANPDQRPQDPVALAEMIHQCLMKTERRRALAQRFGIPFMTTIPRRADRPRGRLLRRTLAFGAILLAAAAVAAILLPEPIGRILHQNNEKKSIGVLVGVPDISPAPGAQDGSTATAPTMATSQPANPAQLVPNQLGTNSTPLTGLSQTPSPGVDQAQTSNPQFVAATTPATSPSASSNTSVSAAENSAQPQDNSSAQAPNAFGVTPETATAAPSTSRNKRKSVASNSKRPRIAQNSRYWQPGVPSGSVRARVVGATPDGRLIMRLPSGRAVIVTPGSDDEEEFVPRRHRRAFIERDELFAPPPRFAPDYSPYD
jgi:serine/threonine protein kinase